MSKRRIRRKRRARVNIKPLILAGVIIAGIITVSMSVNLKGADKEPPTEEIYITETPQAENTEPVTETEQEAKLEHDLNYTYPYSRGDKKSGRSGSRSECYRQNDTEI